MTTSLPKKSFRSEVKLVISPSALTKENTYGQEVIKNSALLEYEHKEQTSQLALGPLQRVQLCPPIWIPDVLTEPTGWILSHGIVRTVTKLK